ncbi:sigma-70 family RNA polymerase sigma factor [Mumia sp. ZJ430]|uniref:sigma-70 family RNA polymerase sigma factor n=1 Tax=Mumia sp. ZJ430 TaxID=2708083 RepID=UPI00141F152E|nr:sigma-70 family RNA polymerase sigma factor [Mumia sp. ZJ430]
MTSLGPTFSPLSTAPSPSAYAHALTAVPLLSAQEEVALAETYAAGRAARERLLSAEVADGAREALAEVVAQGARARTHLVLANVRLVVSFARRLDECGVPFADLVQEGVVGLIRAVEGFDPSRGFRFSTYAAPWVKRHIADAAGSRRVVRLPPKAELQVVACREVAETLHRESGRAPSAGAVAERVGIPEDRVERLLAADTVPVSLDALESDVVAARGEAVDPRVCWAVREALAVLPEVEREVVERRFGIDGGGARSLRAVALELDCGLDVVRAQEQRALQTLRDHPAVAMVAP